MQSSLVERQDGARVSTAPATDRSDRYLRRLVQGWVARFLATEADALVDLADFRRGQGVTEVVRILKHGRGVGAGAIAVLLGDVELAAKYRNQEILTLDHLMAAEELNCEGFGQLLQTLQARSLELVSNFFSAASRQCVEEALEEDVSVRRNVEGLCTAMGFGIAEERLLNFICARQLDAEFRNFLFCFEHVTDRDATRFLASMLDLDESAVRSAMRFNGSLQRAGLAHFVSGMHAMEDKFGGPDNLGDLLSHPYDSVDDLIAAFLTPVKPTSLIRADFAHLEKELAYAERFLAAASCSREMGINLMLYGPPGAGKSEFASFLAESLGGAAYVVDACNDDGLSMSGSERVSRFRLQQYLLARRDRCVLIFDEAEDVFPESGFGNLARVMGGEGRGRGVTSKAWMNEMLENNPVPTIWISNQIGQIDRAYLRRFGLHIRLDLPPLAARREIIRKRVEHLSLSGSTMEAMAENDGLSPAQITTAVRTVEMAMRCNHTAEPVDPDRMLRDVLQGGLEASGLRPLKVGEGDQQDFGLRFLNVACRTPLDRLFEVIRPDQPLSMLFHGRPGTGKTALAAQLAKHVERPLLSYRVSDLQSKWVGETEKNIASMFQRASRDGGVLFLDEADSLLRSRIDARAGWEVSQVNELLQQMELFQGIFICATNLLENLDPASIRRFTLKLEFRHLEAAQRIALLARELDLYPETLSAKVATGLHGLEGLTVGDFAAVRQQRRLFDEQWSPDEWLDRLRDELAYRAEGTTRTIGFVQVAR